MKYYEKDKSLIRACLNNDLNTSNVINAYVQGSLGNPGFREFYMAINRINNPDFEVKTEPANEYTLENEGFSWIYTTVIDGEKISLISSDYERLSKKIKDRNLPF